MGDWLTHHSTLLQLALSAAMVVIWVVYLQLILSNWLHQRRPMILINQGAGVGLQARCFISNLGVEPIYVLDILIALETDGGLLHARITDRAELTEDQLNNPRDATNQGPLQSGHMADIGAFGDLLDRARQGADLDLPTERIRAMTLTVVATSAASNTLIGAERRYALAEEDGVVRLRSAALAARQIRSWLERRRLRRRLRA